MIYEYIVFLRLTYIFFFLIIKIKAEIKRSLLHCGNLPTVNPVKLAAILYVYLYPEVILFILTLNLKQLSKCVHLNSLFILSLFFILICFEISEMLCNFNKNNNLCKQILLFFIILFFFSRTEKYNYFLIGESFFFI